MKCITTFADCLRCYYPVMVETRYSCHMPEELVQMETAPRYKSNLHQPSAHTGLYNGGFVAVS